MRGYPTIMDISSVIVGDYQWYKSQVNKLNQINFIENSLYGYNFAIYKKLLQEDRVESFRGYYTQSRYIMNLYQNRWSEEYLYRWVGKRLF